MVVRTSGAADEHLDGALGPEVGFHDVMQAFCSIDVHEDRLRSRCDVTLSCSRRARLHRIELHARDARTALLPMTSASGLSCLIDCPLISALRPVLSSVPFKRLSSGPLTPSRREERIASSFLSVFPSSAAPALCAGVAQTLRSERESPCSSVLLGYSGAEGLFGSLSLGSQRMPESSSAAGTDVFFAH